MPELFFSGILIVFCTIYMVLLYRRNLSTLHKNYSATNVIEIPSSITNHTIAAFNGDESSLGVIFQFYRPRLYAHALRICGNTPLAQDAVQDTFISAFTHLSSLRNVSFFYPWLKKILLNNCYLLLRRERSVELTDKISRKDLMMEDSLNERMENISNSQRIFDALGSLSAELRSCMLLRYFSKLNTYEEIAVVLGIPVGTVRSRLAAARQKLTGVFIKTEDADDIALKEATQWSGFYFEKWNLLYRDLQSRNEFFEHLLPQLSIRFTSGKSGKGRNILESEISDDLYYGSRTIVNEVVSSGNISVIEATSFNHPDYPHRCSPGTTLVLFRKKDKVETVHICDSPRA